MRSWSVGVGKEAKWLSIVVVVEGGSGQQEEENEKEAGSLKGHVFLLW